MMRLNQTQSPAQEALLPLAGLLYLGFPFCLFVFFWLKAGFAFVFFGLFVYWVYLEKNAFHHLITWKPGKKHLLLFGCALILVILAGTGGFLWQTGDHAKHEAVFFDLLQKKWPVRYGTDGSFLCYYLGYYLPPAFFSKYVFAKAFLPYLTVLWAALGLFLGMMLFLRAVGKNPSLWLLSLFFLQDGPDILMLSLNAVYSKYILSDLSVHANFLQFIYFDNPFGDDLGLRYQAGLGLLFWVPQHWLASSIAAGVFMLQGKASSMRYVLPVFAFTFFWSGFVAVGLAPLGLWVFFRSYRNNQMCLTESMFAIVCVFMMAAFYAAHAPLSEKAWLVSNRTEALKYLMFVVMELGIAVFIFWRSGRLNSDGGLAVWVLVGLILVPLYRIGQYNDFCSRASMPLLWVLSVLAAMYSKSLRAKILLSLGFVFPLYLLFASIYFNLNGIKEVHGGKSLEALNEFPGFMQQYLGEGESFFGKYMLKKTVPAD